MLRKLLKPFASLRLTVVLLALAMLLVYAGTWAQVTVSNWDVQKQYFYSTWVRVPLSTFFTRVADGGKSIPGSIILPGGYTLGLLFLINLLAAHALRFKMTRRDAWLLPGIGLFVTVYYLTRHLGGTGSAVLLALAGIPFVVPLILIHQKRSGIILIHLGVILLFVGEGISSKMKVENNMTIEAGSYANYTYDPHTIELAVVDHSPKDHDDVTVISADRLAQGGSIKHPSLPFELKIDAYYENTQLASPREALNGPHATAGVAHENGYDARGIPKFAGTGEAASRLDLPSAYVTPVASGQPLGTYLATTVPLREDLPQINGPQSFEFNGKPYTVQLRWKRTYKPYTVYLEKFSFDRYTGTEVARNYSSDIRFVDPTQGEDRMVRIWMNHPLRYEGETFFQSDFDHETEHGTVLQVVRNPAWRMPYVACVIGGAGLLLHFGIVLFGFIRKQGKLANRETKAGLAAAEFIATIQAGGGRSERRRNETKPPTLPRPEPVSAPAWRDLAVPALVGVIAVVYLVSQLFPATPSGHFDVRTFSQLPVAENGRVQPWDSVARVTLRSISGRDTLEMKVGDETKRIPAADWLMDVLFAPEKAAEDYKPFRVDYPDLVGRLTTSTENEKFFSLNQILARWDEFAPQLIVGYEGRSEGRKLSDYQSKLVDLGDKLRLYFKLAGPDNVPDYRAFHLDSPQLRQVLGIPQDRALISLRDIASGGKAKVLLDLVSSDADPAGAGSADELGAVRAQARNLMQSIRVFQRMCPAESLRIVPPASGQDWQSIEMAEDEAQQAGTIAQPVQSYSEMRQAYEANLPARFNKIAATFYTSLERQVPKQAAKASFEARFNSYDPFLKCIALYIAAFVLVCLSWLSESWRKLFYRSAAALIGVALVVHTIGLVGRIYISGRPPVTNLTSASIFIAWGALLMALGVEYFFRNSMGLLVAAAAGFGSLFLSEALTVTEGDTLKVLQAVLDTNFWLATHVTCVTLGYAATILAGLLGIVYIVRGLLTDTLDKEQGREIARMTYGVVCFAMFFSFVGTVLGGIWADQSWGRFWGWDSKENGAVLVVLTNAILLHARWGGLVRERGIAVLAVWGIMVTQWSFFGTNQLGVGLHAYGFTEGLWHKLLLFWGIELAVLGMGLIPLKYWASFRETPAEPLPPDASGAVAAPV